MTGVRFARVVAMIGVVFWVVIGLWAFFAPRSFVDNVGTFEPYNEHYVHDAGAFALGIGVTLILALANLPALTTALTGSAVAAGLHEIAHFLDKDLGGKDTDPITLGIFAILTIAAAASAWPRGRRSPV